MVLCVDGVRRRQIIGLHAMSSSPTYGVVDGSALRQRPDGGPYMAVDEPSRSSNQSNPSQEVQVPKFVAKFGKKAENRVLP